MHRAGKPIDLVTLRGELILSGQLEDAGGVGYLATLQSEFISTANLPTYLDTLSKHAVIRQVASLTEDLWRDIRSCPENAGTILRVGTRALESLGATWNRSTSTKPPLVVDAAHFVDQAIEYPPELVLGLLHKGSKLVFGGSSKSYKTWVLLDLAISLSAGVPWLGFNTRKSRVLVVNMEIQAPFFAKRIRMICAAKGIQLEPGFLKILNLRGQTSSPAALIQEIERIALAEKIDAIVLDPIYKLYGADMDENSAGDVARLLNSIESLAVKTGAGVAFGAHFSKGNQAGKESIDRVSGSGVFARDPDTLITLTKHEVEGALTVECTLRNHPPVEPFVLRWNAPLMERDETLDPARLKKTKGRAKAYAPSDLLKVLPGAGLTTMEWAKAAEAEFGIARRTFHNLKRQLQEDGFVIKEQVTENWKARRAAVNDGGGASAAL